MTDYLVRLYDLPAAARPLPPGVVVRRALAPERRIVVDWVAKTFGRHWEGECEVAFGAHPIMTWIAVREDSVLGFACGDATAKGFFGPTGVAEAERGQGIGEALLMATLAGLREAGYAYAVIGSPGPVDWYLRRLDALAVPKSNPGFYRGMLPKE